MHYIDDFEGGAGPGASSRSTGAADKGSSATTILARLSDEMARCADLAAGLQDALTSSAHSAQDEHLQTGSSSFDIKRMQSLDLLEQTLRDLRTVTTALAAEGTTSDVATIVKGCKLDDVARRLQGLSVAAHTDEADFF